MNLKIQLVKTKEEYDDILEIRKQVFVREQNVPESIEIEYENAYRPMSFAFLMEIQLERVDGERVISE